MILFEIRKHFHNSCIFTTFIIFFYFNVNFVTSLGSTNIFLKIKIRLCLKSFSLKFLYLKLIVCINITKYLMYRVSQNRMQFLKRLKMSEKLNPHNQTPRFYYHNTPPFYFITNNSIIFFFQNMLKLGLFEDTGFC